MHILLVQFGPQTAKNGTGNILDQELISYRYISGSSSCFLLVLAGATPSKSPMLRRFNRIGMKFSRIVLQLKSRIFDLTSHFQDGGHNVISHGKVLPPGE